MECHNIWHKPISVVALLNIFILEGRQKEPYCNIVTYWKHAL